MHPDISLLQAFLDEELSENNKTDTIRHLQKCELCKGRLSEIVENQNWINDRLSTLEPHPEETPEPDFQKIVLRFSREESPGRTFKKPVFRPAWSAGLLTLALAISLAFPSIRAAASQLLQIFRVQQMTAFPLETLSLASFDTNPTLLETISEVFSESVTITSGQPDTSLEVISYQEAMQITPFDFRYPEWEHEFTNLTVNQAFEFEFIADLGRIQETINALGQHDMVLPPEIDQAKIEVVMPAMVTTAYGECWDPQTGKSNSIWKWDQDCLVFYQSTSPIVSSPANIDPAILAEIGMQVLGVSEAEAAAFSQASDWTTTLVLPIPRNDATYEEVIVDNSDGLLLHFFLDGKESSPIGFALVWFKDDIGYSIIGNENEALAFELADSLK